MTTTTMIIITASVLLILALIPMLRKKKTILALTRNLTTQPTSNTGNTTAYRKHLLLFTLLPSLGLITIALMVHVFSNKLDQDIWSIITGISIVIPIAILQNGYREAGPEEIIAVYKFGGKELTVIKGGAYFKGLFMETFSVPTSNIPFDFGQIEAHSGEIKDWAAITTATAETCDWDAFKKYWISDYLHDIEEPTPTDNNAAEIAYYKRFNTTIGKDAEVKTMMERNNLHKQVTFGPKVFGLLKIIETKVFNFIANVPGKDVDEKKKNLIESVKQLTISVLNTEFKKFTHAQLIILSQGRSLNKALENALDSLLSGGAKNNNSKPRTSKEKKDTGIDCILAEITKLGGSHDLHMSIDKAQQATIEKQATITAAEAESEKLILEGEGKSKAKKADKLAEAEGVKALKLAEAEGTKAQKLAEAEGVKALKLAEAEGDSRFISLLIKQAEDEKVDIAKLLEYWKYVKQSENKNATYIIQGGSSNDAQTAMFSSIIDKALEKFKSTNN